MNHLIQRAKRGEKHALRELLLRQRPIIEAVVARNLWDGAMRDDVTQNIMLTVVKSIKTFAGSCRLSTWVYRIAVNECMEGNRRSARWSGRIDRARDAVIFADLNAPDGLTEAIRREQHDIVRASIATLPKGMKEAFELYYGEGCSGAEAARRLDISVTALFVRLSDARSRLRDTLLERGVAP
jgi:RNA polymerase sigma-70 factor (ECF subfamily)